MKLSRSKIYRDISRGVLLANSSDTGKITIDARELERAYGASRELKESLAVDPLSDFQSARPDADEALSNVVDEQSWDNFSTAERPAPTPAQQQSNVGMQGANEDTATDLDLKEKVLETQLRERDEQIGLLNAKLQEVESTSNNHINQLREQLTATEARAVELERQVEIHVQEKSELGGAEVGRNSSSRLKFGLRSRSRKIDRITDGLLKLIAIDSLVLAVIGILTVLVLSTGISDPSGPGSIAQ